MPGPAIRRLALRRLADQAGSARSTFSTWLRRCEGLGSEQHGLLKALRAHHRALPQARAFTKFPAAASVMIAVVEAR